jgi:Skp family chaperone for outer membrane proteins|tara:strand:+ start:7723 stop:8235 length:513 start_codon:yes stop_codon:yes gene_type:complete
MNKVKIILATAVFALTFSTSQLALANAIVVLKAEQAIFATAKAIALGKNLSAQLEPQAVRFDAMGKKLQALQQRFVADKDLMSSDELQTLQAEIQTLNGEYQGLQQYLANAKVGAEQEFLASMRPALDKVLRELIEKNNISLIINGQSVIYNSAGIDITPKVVELLNLEP